MDILKMDEIGKSEFKIYCYLKIKKYYGCCQNALFTISKKKFITVYFIYLFRIT